MLPTSVGILDWLHFTSMRFRLGGCLYAHTGELQNKCFAEFTLLLSSHSSMTDLFVKQL